MKGETLYCMRDLRKGYRSGFTLHVRQMDVPLGQVLGLLGPTGAGKSTLLRMLAGLESPSSGSIHFAGTLLDATALPLTTLRRITLVPQRPILLAGTVRLNVEYGLRLRRIRHLDQKVDSTLDQLGLTEIASQSAQTLSGGQIQLVALARALVITPDVLLLDEPTAHLDPAHVALVERAVGRFQQESHATIVWATHNLFQTRRVAVRASLLLDGRLVEVGRTEQLFTNPSDPRTADFIQGRIVY